MNIKYLKKKEKELSKIYSLYRAKDGDGVYYVMLKNGVFFNPFGEGHKEAKFAYHEYVPEDVAIQALVDVIRIAAMKEIHCEWVARKEKRDDERLQEKIKNRLKHEYKSNN